MKRTNWAIRHGPGFQNLESRSLGENDPRLSHDAGELGQATFISELWFLWLLLEGIKNPLNAQPPRPDAWGPKQSKILVM